jgi:hypothetical protein
MSLTLTRPPLSTLPVLTGSRVVVPVPLDDVAPAAPASDIVEEWGMQSFPASDPPANW